MESSHINFRVLVSRKLCSGAIGEEALVGGDGAGGEDSPLSVSSTDPLIDDQISLIPGFQVNIIQMKCLCYEFLDTYLIKLLA